MEDILELILSILFMPFESKFDCFLDRLNHIGNKPLRVLIKILLFLGVVAILFCLCCLLSRIFRGYWIQSLKTGSVNMTDVSPPQRKSIRVKDYDYSTPGAYFITVCTANREKIFWNSVGADTMSLHWCIPCYT